MKFELKTENEKYSNSFSNILKAVFTLALIIIFCDVALKLRIISRHYQIEYKCRNLSFEKSNSNFKATSQSKIISPRKKTVFKKFENDFI